MRAAGLRRYLRAALRDTRLLVRQSRWSLAAFVLLVIACSLCLRYLYIEPVSGQQGLSWGRAVHATLLMVFLENTLDYPAHNVAVQALFIVVPLVGVVVLADSIVRFGVALFNRRERKEAWQVAVASTLQDHVIVCGLGRVGFRVAEQLLELEEDVVGVEIDAQCPFLPELYARHVPVILADARQPETLKKANVAGASAIVVCTADDLANLDIALDARELHPGIKVVLRMFDTRLADKVQRGFGIHTAFSTSALAAPLFAAAATRTQTDYSFALGGERLHVARATVARESLLEGQTITQIEQDLGVAVIAHRREGAPELRPPPELILVAGDEVVLVAPLAGLRRLRGITDRKRRPARRRPPRDGASGPSGDP